MGQKSPIRQLLDGGWRYTPGGMRIPAGMPRSGAGQNVHGPWLPASEAVARNHELLPASSMTEEELRRHLERQLQNARAQVQSLRAGWRGRAARRAARFPNMSEAKWRELERVLPDAEARLEELKTKLAEARNRALQQTGRLPGTTTNPAGRGAPASTPAAGTRLPGGAGEPPRTVDLRAPSPPGSGAPRGGRAGGGGRVGLLGGLLAAGEGALIWVADKLPRFARGPMTRFAIWGPRAVQGVVTLVGNTVAAVLSAPIVIKGAVVLGTLIIVGGVIYLVLPSGEVIEVGADSAAYVVVLRSAEGFDGGDVSLERIEGDPATVLAERAAASGYTLEVKMGPYTSFEEARDALCGNIAAGSIQVGPGGIRYATFGFDGRRYGFPENPCDPD